jgi:hypothetical protein
MLTRSVLIRKIFEQVPFTYKGVNRNGEHIVQLDVYNTTMYATLERLSNTELNKLAAKLKIKLLEEEYA